MPNPPRPRPFTPRSRAEAAAPLTAVEEACKADAGYLAGVAAIVASVLKDALAVTEPAPPPGETAAARAIRQSKTRVEQMQKHLFNQVANNRSAA